MATENLQVYKCEICGAIVEVVRSGGGNLVCCNEKMVLLTENTTDAATEKHIPVIEKSDCGVTVTVGSVAHPMQEDHFIEWIELIADGNVYRQNLKPGDAPEAKFCVTGTSVTARAYCNLHGLWKA